MADAPHNRDYAVTSASPPATCSCGKVVRLGEYSLVRTGPGESRVQCYDCRPARDAQPARLGSAL